MLHIAIIVWDLWLLYPCVLSMIDVGCGIPKRVYADVNPLGACY